MSDKDEPVLSVDLVSDIPELTLGDLSGACGLTVEHINAYVAEGIIEPHGSSPGEWRFSQISLVRVRRARRLERDLGLNIAGLALALDLMTQIENLKSRLARFEAEI